MRGRSEKTSDEVATCVPISVRFNASRGNQDTRHDRLDRLIVRVFPYFIVICLILSVILIYVLGSYNLAGIVYGLCFAFAIGFCVLGLACVILSDRGSISWKLIIPAVILVPMAVGGVLFAFGEDFDPSVFLVKFFGFGEDVSLYGLVISVYTVILMITLAAYGVVSVIVGYFRSYFYRVMRALESPPDKRKNHIPEWLFQIPDIIDVKSVELEPDDDDEGFNVHLFVNTALSIFTLGLVICSYLFLNPFFLQEIDFDEMILISTMLSLFLSPLVIPWSIVRSIGAKVKSDAPRDFYLWKGMKGRLYQGFFAITLFMMLVTISAYMGMDFSRIATTYLAYILFMILISGITSFVYVNVYYKGFKNGIVKSYMQSRENQR